MKVGDYVRTKFGDIGELEHIGEYNINIKFGKHIQVIAKAEDYKSSPNIIDLIEVGDYVNGIYIEKNNGKYLETLEDDYDNSRLGHIEFITIYPNEIKSIVTKEQFESMEYRIGE